MTTEPAALPPLTTEQKELERAMSSASERQFAASLEASDVWAQLTVGAS